MKQYRALFLLLALLFTVSYGQTARSMHWYFGHKAGIDFSSGSPVADTNGQLVSIENSSTISDPSGNLLFYSNGTEVRNRQHAIMPNGSGINGNQSALQGSIVIPIPTRPNDCYLVVISESGTLSYSKIDMTLNNGLGAITEKNVLLGEHSSEGMAATIHCNQENYWLLIREVAGTVLKFRSYEISASGMSAPVISSFLLPEIMADPVSSITFAETGNILCYTALGTQAIYLFDFDQQTGGLAFRDSISTRENEIAYSTAFSGSKTKLYATMWDQEYCRVSQFDLNAADITASRVDLDSVYFGNGSPNGYGFIGQMRLTPHHQLLISRWKQNNPPVTTESPYSLDSLDCIQFPDLAGTAAGFQRNYLYLRHSPTMLGLPNFVSTFTGEVDLDFHCPDTTASLRENGFTGIEIYPNPVKTELNVHTTSAGEFTLELFDNTGKSLQHVVSSGESAVIGMSGLAAGIYFLKVNRADTIETFRIIKD